MEKYGFVYLWFNHETKRYYVGSHWGSEDDSYICSSNWMRNTYKRHPKAFKRRILKRVYTNRADTFTEEERFLQMIKPEELKVRYYNISRSIKDHWSQYPDKVLTLREKMSNAKIKIRKWQGETNPNYDPELRAKITKSTRGKKRTPEQINYMSERQQERFKTGFETWNKGRTDLPSSWNKGKEWSKVTKDKMSKSRIGKTPWNKGKPMDEDSKLKMITTVLAQNRQRPIPYDFEIIRKDLRTNKKLRQYYGCGSDTLERWKTLINTS